MRFSTWWLLSAYLACQLSFVFGASDAYRLRVDDAYYYFGVAANVVDRGRFSFDGIHETNGFQPLWQAVLIGATWVFQTIGIEARETMVCAYLTLCALLNTASAAVLMSLARKLFGGQPRAAAVSVFAALWFPGITVPLLTGMENSVNWLLIHSLVWRLADDRGRLMLPALGSSGFWSLVVLSALPYPIILGHEIFQPKSSR